MDGVGQWHASSLGGKSVALQFPGAHSSATLTKSSLVLAAAQILTITQFLLHSPYGGKQARLTSWKAVEDAIEEGEIKTGGVSNFGVRHLEELMASKPRILPAVNQIEVHPFNTRSSITSFCQKHGILVEAYAPLARALRMKHPTIVELSDKYGCTPAQLMVRWSCQNGFIPLPKSVSKQRIEANGSIDFFEITNEDMKRLSDLDEYLVTDWE